MGFLILFLHGLIPTASAKVKILNRFFLSFKHQEGLAELRLFLI